MKFKDLLSAKYWTAVSDVLTTGKADITIDDTTQITFDQRGVVKTMTLPDGRKVYAEFSKKGISMGSIGGGDPIAIWRISPTKLVDAGKAMAANYGIVYACVSAVADEIAQMVFKLFTVNEDGGPEETTDHEILDLLDGVNEFQTGPEFKWTLASHLELTGNAYILLIGVKSDKDKPKSMFLLDPSRVRPLFDKTSFPWVVRQYEFTIENKVYRYEPYEILHLKYPDASDPYIGLGKVQAAGYYIDLDNDAISFNRNFFMQGSKIGPVLESEATDEATLERLRLSWETSHQGAGNAHRPFVMPKGIKLADNQPKAQDMDFGNLMKESLARVMLVFRVSRTILGTAESDTNRATAETADYVFAKRTIKPKMQQICSCLNEFLVPRYGDDIYLGFLDPTPEDKNFRIQEMKAVVNNQPVMTQNEAREKFQGLGPVPGGEKLLVQNNMMPVGTAAPDEHPENTDVSGKPQNSGDSGDGNPSKTLPKKAAIRYPKPRFYKNMQVRRQMKKDYLDIVADKLKGIASKKTSELTNEEYLAVWQKFVDRTNEWSKKLHDGMLEINKGQEAEVLSNLPKWYEANKKAFTFADLFDAKKWVSAIIDMATPILLEQATVEGAAAAAGFGKPGLNILEDAGVKDALEKSISLLGERYNETTLTQIEKVLTTSLQAGDSLDQMTDKIQGVYGFASSVRAEMVAKTETFRVGNLATKAGWQQTGVKTIKWYTAEDDAVCPFCQQEDGKIISVEDNFYNKGDVITLSNGDSMPLDYSNIESPPLHPLCRCYIRPEDVGDAGLE